jgi:hypothetical protein
VPGARFGTIAEDIDPTLHRVGSADGTAGLEISEGEAPTRTIAVRTQGPTATVDAAAEVKLGEAAALGVARLTDGVSASGDMVAYMAAVVTALTTIAAQVPVGITPPIPPTVIGQISQASTKVKSE